MEIYSLTRRGRRLAHNIRHEDTSAWRIIHYLSRMHTRSKEQIISEVPGATADILAKLQFKRIIVEESGVDV